MTPNGKIRVSSSTEYTIEVNDKGETISFDTADTSLTPRLFKMYEEVDRITREYEARGREIDARPDKPAQTAQLPDPENPGQFITKVLITQNQYDGTKLVDDFYQEARGALDQFLGDGACQKIFGSKNYMTMFDDLLEQLGPEFKQMGINAEDIKKSAAKKHAPNREARRALK